MESLRRSSAFWVGFIGLNRWILIAVQLAKLNQLYFCATLMKINSGTLKNKHIVQISD